MTSPTTRTAAGPLRVSTRNPRYFTPPSADGTERAVYLTGSHIWNNLHDGMGPGPVGPADPERFDFDGYLRFLTERGHNFIRLWRWEQVRSQAAGGFHLNMTPQPWARTGPGLAKDGKPRFDLDQFDPAFFERLRQRVVKAGEAGIYVGVMLFDGERVVRRRVGDEGVRVILRDEGAAGLGRFDRVAVLGHRRGEDA